MFIDNAGNLVVRYTYDTWGKLLSIAGSLASTVGEKNPYRYRGYRYGTETGLYYLNSHYYNPDWGRFINADSQLNPSLGLLGINMFAYCGNNIDLDGHAFMFITGAIGAIAGAVIGVVAAAKSGKNVWAGGQPAQKAAETFSKVTLAGTTIANTPIGWQGVNQTKNLPWKQLRSLRDSASLQFAQQASGGVNAFIYAPNFNNQSIFMTTELPAIMGNPNVNKIIITIFRRCYV